MTPHTRTAYALGLSLILWCPVAVSVLTGGTDLSVGGLYYLGALGLSWVGTGILSNITRGYRESVNRVEATKRQIELLESQNAAQQRRRAEDKVKEPGSGADDSDLPPTV